MYMPDFFNREINLIQNEDLAYVVRGYITSEVPAYFWTDGASSSGKYHPKMSQGVGGLVRHTKAVVKFAEELLQMVPYVDMKQEYKDYVIAACIVHDTVKYGSSNTPNRAEYKNHARNAAKAFHSLCLDYDYPVSDLLLNAVRSHMGQWSTPREDAPFTQIDQCVHMADYIASRSFIDIPSITEEYEEVLNSPLPSEK